MKRIDIQAILTLAILFLLFIPSASWANRMITGTILTPTGQPAVGVIVKAYDEDNDLSEGKDDPMGSPAITNEQGRYSIGPYTGQPWDGRFIDITSRRPDIYIKVDQMINGRQVTVGKSKTHKDHRQAQDLTIDLQLKGIVGTVTDRSGRALKGTIVKAFDEDDYSQDDFMNEVRTDSNGAFVMTYEQKYKCQRVYTTNTCWDPHVVGTVKRRPDIYIEVYDKVRSRQIKINNKSATTVNVAHRDNVHIQESVPNLDDIDYTTSNPWEDNDVLHVLAYNVYMLPAVPTGQAIRVPYIVQEILRDKYDVIVFSEVFDNDIRKELREKLESVYPYHSKVPETDAVFSDDGGVQILSKWPIENGPNLKGERRVFGTPCLGWDCRAEKGIVYVKINKNGTRYHIFGTHVQANEDPDETNTPRTVRDSQFQKIKNFIDEKNIPATEAVIIAGDLNVDKTENLNEYNEMLQTLNAVPPELIGHPYSADGKINDFRDLGDSRQLLDYVLYSKAHRQPTKHFVRQTGIRGSQLVPAAYNRVMFYRSDKQWREFPTERYRWDISDHYPVFGWFDFKVDRSIIEPSIQSVEENRPTRGTSIKPVEVNRSTTGTSIQSVEPSLLQMAPRP